MSSSTSLASARRRKGVQNDSAPSANLGNSFIARMAGGGLRNYRMQQQPQQQPQPQPQPQSQTTINLHQGKAVRLGQPAGNFQQTHMNQSSAFFNGNVHSSLPSHKEDNVTREFSGIGDVAKFEASDRVTPITKDNGTVMFGIRDIVKIHEKKLVQHENSLANHSKTIMEIEEQSFQCINELDEKCETLFHKVNEMKSNPNYSSEVSGITIPQVQEEIATYVKNNVNAYNSVNFDGVSNAEIPEMKKQLLENSELYNALYAEFKGVQVDVNYLKQMMLNIQSSHTEMNRTMMRLLNSTPVPSITEHSRPEPEVTNSPISTDFEVSKTLELQTAPLTNEEKSPSKLDVNTHSEEPNDVEDSTEESNEVDANDEETQKTKNVSDLAIEGVNETEGEELESAEDMTSECMTSEDTNETKERDEDADKGDKKHEEGILENMSALDKLEIISKMEMIDKKRSQRTTKTKK